MNLELWCCNDIKRQAFLSFPNDHILQPSRREFHHNNFIFLSQHQHQLKLELNLTHLKRLPIIMLNFLQNQLDQLDAYILIAVLQILGYLEEVDLLAFYLPFLQLYPKLHYVKQFSLCYLIIKYLCFISQVAIERR